MAGVTLVIMAAGLGSRYGGLKQLAGVGPAGETLLEYSVYDAIRAGFDKIVFVLQPGMEKIFRRHISDKISMFVDVISVSQDLSFFPAGCSLPAGRTKPLGTVHALLSVKNIIDTPFALINSDDFYGSAAFQVMYHKILNLPTTNEACMPAYCLGNTLSANGSVSRGVCDIDSSKLLRIREARKITICDDGFIRYASHEDGEADSKLSESAPVSMNFWGFTPWIFEYAERYFAQFLDKLDPSSINDECILSDMVDSMISKGLLSVSVMETNSKWFGITYCADKPLVQAAINELVVHGVYPQKLFAID